MRPKLYATVSKNTTAVLHRVMKEQDCNKSQAVDFIAEYYSKMQNNLRERQVIVLPNGYLQDLLGSR